MNTTMNRSLMCGCFAIIFSAISCAPILSITMKGGKAVNAEYQPRKVLVSYHAEGEVPKDTKYYLVETEEGEAILEKTENKVSALFTTHWRDDLGDHFSAWIVGGPAYEFIVPIDRTKPASRYFYPKNQYDVGGKRGLGAVSPHGSYQPVTKLTPE